jgi:hypothetical protein
MFRFNLSLVLTGPWPCHGWDGGCQIAMVTGNEVNNRCPHPQKKGRQADSWWAEVGLSLGRLPKHHFELPSL